MRCRRLALNVRLEINLRNNVSVFAEKTSRTHRADDTVDRSLRSVYPGCGEFAGPEVVALVVKVAVGDRCPHVDAAAKPLIPPAVDLTGQRIPSIDQRVRRICAERATTLMARR